MKAVLGKYEGTVAETYTWITSYGKVIRQGDGGVLIFSESDQFPQAVLAVSEVSDDKIINLFLDPVNGNIIPDEYHQGRYEILA